MIRELGIAVVPVSWRESEVNFEEPSAGRRWVGRGKVTVKDLLFKSPTAEFAMAAVTEKDLGWIAIDVPPGMVNQVIEGRGFGLAVYDKGLRGDRIFDARESVRFAPYLLVEAAQP